jgi:hypothetical protein
MAPSCPQGHASCRLPRPMDHGLCLRHHDHDDLHQVRSTSQPGQQIPGLRSASLSAPQGHMSPLGKKSIAEYFARCGAFLSATTIGRRLKTRRSLPPPGHLTNWEWGGCRVSAAHCISHIFNSRSSGGTVTTSPEFDIGVAATGVFNRDLTIAGYPYGCFRSVKGTLAPISGHHGEHSPSQRRIDSP